MGRYDYEELKNAAKNGGNDECAALAEWFDQYDMKAWNGEYYDCDEFALFPIYGEEDEDGCFPIIGWEVR